MLASLNTDEYLCPPPGLVFVSYLLILFSEINGLVQWHLLPAQCAVYDAIPCSA